MENVGPGLCAAQSLYTPSLSLVTRLEVTTAYFEAVILSYWDNILGPRLQQVWLGPDEKNIKESCIQYVVSRTLHGELLRNSPNNVIDSKLYIMREHDMVCVSFIFMGYAKGGQSIYSLAFILPCDHLQIHLRYDELVELHIKKSIATLKVLQLKDLLVAKTSFSSSLKTFFTFLNRILQVGIPDDVPFNDTFFSAKQEAGMDDLFLRRVITSFLQTFGCAVIVGVDIKEINLLVNTLALFLSPSERSRSCYAVEGTGCESYGSDLYIQGLVKKDIMEVPQCPDILTSQYPTTLVDLDHMTVQQTQPYHQHQITRSHFLDLHLTLLWRGEESAPINPIQGVFHESDDIAILVQNCVTELSLLPSTCGIREAFVQQFGRLLDRKGLALLKYVQTASLNGARSLGVTDVKQLKMDLCLTAEADFRIVLVRAEKYQPGLFKFLMGTSHIPSKPVKAMLEAL